MAPNTPGILGGNECPNSVAWQQPYAAMLRRGAAPSARGAPAAPQVLALLIKLHGGVHKQGAQVGAADADGHLQPGAAEASADQPQAAGSLRGRAGL